jgi:hypothetical protein
MQPVWRLVNHFSHQRRKYDNGPADQDHEYRGAIAGIGKIVVQPAFVARGPQRQETLKKPAFATSRAATAQAAADRQFVRRVSHEYISQ